MELKISKKIMCGLDQAQEGKCLFDDRNGNQCCIACDETKCAYRCAPVIIEDCEYKIEIINTVVDNE